MAKGPNPSLTLTNPDFNSNPKPNHLLIGPFMNLLCQSFAMAGRYLITVGFLVFVLFFCYVYSAAISFNGHR